MTHTGCHWRDTNLVSLPAQAAHQLGQARRLLSEAAVEYLIRVLAIILGAALGSVIRHSADTSQVTFLRGIPLLARFATTAVGSFLAGFFAAHFALLGQRSRG
jgi:hypothetical protein